VAINSTADKSNREAKSAHSPARDNGKSKLLQEMQRRNFYARAFNSFSRHKALSARDRNLSEFGQ
jgi:hypothetical protein